VAEAGIRGKTATDRLRAVILWICGVPISVIILLYVFHVL